MQHIDFNKDYHFEKTNDTWASASTCWPLNVPNRTICRVHHEKCWTG